MLSLIDFTMCALCVCINLINLTFVLLLPSVHQMLPNALIAKWQMHPSQRAPQSTQPFSSVCEKKKKHEQVPQEIRLRQAPQVLTADGIKQNPPLLGLIQHQLILLWDQDVTSSSPFPDSQANQSDGRKWERKFSASLLLRWNNRTALFLHADTSSNVNEELLEKVKDATALYIMIVGHQLV